MATSLANSPHSSVAIQAAVGKYPQATQYLISTWTFPSMALLSPGTCSSLGIIHATLLEVKPVITGIRSVLCYNKESPTSRPVQ